MATATDKAKRRRKGERKDKLIQLTKTIGRKPDGKPDRKSFYGKTRAEAAQKRDEYMKRLKAGVSLEDADASVSEWVDTWMSLYKDDLNASNAQCYRAQIKRLKAAIGKIRLVDVREAHLQEALKAVRGMSKSTITKYVMVINQVFARAKANKLIPDNPAELLSVPDGTAGTHRALERWESDCILQNWDKHRCGLWAILMLLCGLRRGEMMALEWENVDLDKRTLRVCAAVEIVGNRSLLKPMTKTDAGMRTLPLCEPLYDALCAVPAEKRSGMVCKSANGKLISQAAYDRGWDGFNLAMTRCLNGEPVTQKGRRVDVEKRRYKNGDGENPRIVFSVLGHDLRHTFATALYDAGVSVKAAQYYLGHSDIRMTLNLYTHLSNERENRSRVQMTDYLDAWFRKEDIGRESI